MRGVNTGAEISLTVRITLHSRMESFSLSLLILLTSSSSSANFKFPLMNKPVDIGENYYQNIRQTLVGFQWKTSVVYLRFQIFADTLPFHL